MTSIRPGSVGAWILALRPRTLPVSLAPVLVGTAVAYQLGGLRVGPALAAALGGCSSRSDRISPTTSSTTRRGPTPRLASARRGRPSSACSPRAP